ncbi:MAG: ABC transporter substrate-binding protein [Chloroflexota bacterium]|nr:MAG: ABC transporter substrate-binding protein [Chloroflexota bacterium]
MKKFLFATVFILIALAACQTAAPPIVSPTNAPAPTATIHIIPTELTVVTHDSFAVSDEALAEFQNANHVKVEILKAGDAGAALNKAILAGADNPLGDVFFGVDNTFLSRATKANLFEAYRAQGIDQIPAEYQRDPEARLTPIDYGYVCMNYDKAWFKQKNLAPPATLQDLLKPEYKGLLVVENPATSSPGLAFLLATVATYGDKYLDFWKELRANEVAISEGWNDAYYNKSTWSGNGDRPLVVSYATSPAAEVFFSEGKLTEPPTGNVLGDGACFLQIEFAGIFKNAKHPDIARRFMDFMLSKKFQEDIPTQMFVYPVNPNAELPDVYKFAEKPNAPAQLDAAMIDANREKWIKEWTQAVLR